ncbi:MAG: UDP-N-acetylmuramate--L-alanine ligase, partial [Oscillospiraceae bacterium]
HLDYFAQVLSIADKVVLSPIMGSREKNTYDIKSEDLANKIENATVLDSFEDISNYVNSFAKEGDMVITLGCGDIYKAAKLMLK